MLTFIDPSMLSRPPSRPLAVFTMFLAITSPSSTAVVLTLDKRE